jgi:hypothetical protein
MGEYLVGAYLKMVEGCDYVDYNVHLPGEGLKGLGELDVVGFKFDPPAAYICEVVTHILGLLYGSSREATVQRIQEKYDRQKEYASERLRQFRSNQHFMLWSPVVHEGYVSEKLSQIEGLELVINEEYAKRIKKLQQLAESASHNEGNPAFRLLQILGHMRKIPEEAR